MRPRLTLAEQLRRLATYTRGGEVGDKKSDNYGHRRGTGTILNGSHRCFRAREASHDQA